MERQAGRCQCAFPAELPKTHAIGEKLMFRSQEQGKIIQLLEHEQSILADDRCCGVGARGGDRESGVVTAG